MGEEEDGLLCEIVVITDSGSVKSAENKTKQTFLGVHTVVLPGIVIVINKR